MKIHQFLKEIYINGIKPKESDLINSHPLQWINSNISIPVWKVEYKYNLSNGKKKKHIKYIMAIEETNDDEVMNKFRNWIDDYNTKHLYRALLNVEILNMSFIDGVELILE